MRIFILSDTWTIALCIIVWFIIHMGAAQICLSLPNTFFSLHARLFRTYKFEQRIYERFFFVRRWKHLLPDGGALWKKRGFSKKRLSDSSDATLHRFLVETARGEMSHWLAITGFWLFGFFTPPGTVWFMLGYVLLANVPCIVAQRYNRPRFARILQCRATALPELAANHGFVVRCFGTIA